MSGLVSAPVDPRLVAAAWINFDGSGTVAIRDSENVASLVDNGVGDYTVNWDRAFAAADYAVVPGGQRTLGESAAGAVNLETDATGQTVGSVHLKTNNDGTSSRDFPIVCAVAFGDLA